MDVKPISVRKTRFSAEELAERDRLAGIESTSTRIYSDEELDALYEQDPVLAMKISREQEQAKRAGLVRRPPNPDAPPPDLTELNAVLEKARRILLQDGGDLELVEVQGSVVRVRLKGNCVGCPNSVLDLKNIVERLVMEQFPQVTEVANTY